MPFGPGVRLGSYEIVGPLGSGGMGEVYRARDSRLARDVALKLLPDTFTHDEERVARFRREAQVLAALNHPHIGSIYGLEEAGAQPFLVLELIVGETLAARIAKGPLPVEEALAVARQIAEALEAAHGKGIVHRDLKPANIALTVDDQVKVLDFGLAKADGSSSAPSVDLTNSPTLASPVTLTGIGTILGTAAYMSPEQAKGRAADKRSDVWAFGCVLYEMLTGNRPFDGDDVSEILAAVLKTSPDLGALPPSLPAPVRGLIDGCLQKDPRERIGDISTALFVLKQPLRAEPVTTSSSRVRHPWLPWLVVLAFAIVGAAIGGALWSRQPPPRRPVTRFAFGAYGGKGLSLARRVLAVSPDGSLIAYSAEGQLFVRALGDFDSRLVPGGDAALYPVFSPDGQSILFWADTGQLKRLAVSGGVPVTVSDGVPGAPFGMTWAGDQVLFVQPGGGIMKVPASGGSAAPLVALDPSQGLADGPQLLPDGDTVLFTVVRGVEPTSNYWDRGQVVAQSIATGRRKTIIEHGADGRYVPTGHIVYAVEGTLMAVPFDLARLEVKGPAVPVVEGVRRTAAWSGGEAQYAFSPSGVLAYVAGPARAGRDDLFLFDRKGAAEALNLPAGSYANPRASPDGKLVALETTEGSEAVVSVYDLSRKSSVRRLTFGGNCRFPIWAADSKHVVFQSDRDGAPAIYWQPIDGGPAERLTTPEAGMSHVPESWLPHGDVLLFTVSKRAELTASKRTESTLWTFSLRDRKAAPFGDVSSIGAPPDAAFSPDGRWVAYQTGQSGSTEATLFVQPYPPTGARFQVARGGRPVWSPDGQELFFVPAPSQFAVVSVSAESSFFTVSEPTPVPRRFGLAPPSAPRPFDMLPDGRFVAVSPADQGAVSAQSEIRVVVNWFDELKAKVPVK